eukprot:c28224_g3_i3 orf=657-2102(-)
MDYCYASAQQASTAFLKKTGRDGPASQQSANRPHLDSPPLLDNWHLGSSPSNARISRGESGLEEGLWQMSLQQEDTDAASGPYPERPGEPDCMYFMRNGVCGFGMKCRFNHPPGDKLATMFVRNKEEFPERIGQPECQYYLKTGTCKFGVACKFHHPREKLDSAGGELQLNFLGLPLRPGEKECAFYLRMGSCKFGLACKFHHPEPAAVGTLMSVPGSPLYTATGTPSAPLPGTYQAGLPSWPVGRSPYIPGPQLQGISSYMPVIVSPPQTISIPSWSTYQGPISPMPSPDGRQQAEFFYGATQHQSDRAGGKRGAITSFGGISSPVLQPQMAQRETLFPERPGQPDCHYYMRTGDCKFGASCKFHHPKDGSTSSSSCALSIIGLPLRPGQPPCTFYIRYGICKFGPTCKFDHPVVGLAYNSSVTSMLDIAMAPTPSGSSPNTVLAPEVSHETPKPQNSIVRSEAPSTYASADGECEDVNL